jgi:hypothetical protein
MRSLLVAASTAALMLIACQPPEQPPVPPKPTDPTAAHALAFQPAEVIDAAIVSEGGSPTDAHVFELDVGAAGRATSDHARRELRELEDGPNRELGQGNCEAIAPGVACSHTCPSPSRTLRPHG